MMNKVVIELDGTLHIVNMDSTEGLIVLLDRKDTNNTLLTINKAPVMITEYTDDDIHPDQLLPALRHNKKLKDVVQVIHTSAFTRIMKSMRNTDNLVKVVPAKNKKLTPENTIKVSTAILASALKKEN